jgi:hypothetical protein
MIDTIHSCSVLGREQSKKLVCPKIGEGWCGHRYCPLLLYPKKGKVLLLILVGLANLQIYFEQVHGETYRLVSIPIYHRHCDWQNGIDHGMCCVISLVRYLFAKSTCS